VSSDEGTQVPVGAHSVGRLEHRVEELLDDPTGDPHALYYQRFDEWSIPFTFGADEGFIYYALVDEPRRVVIMRQLTFGG
jgi:hypothetical protein